MRLPLAPASLALAICGALLVGAPAAAQPQQELAPRTLNRTVDTLVVSGQTFGKALYKRISQLKVYALQGGFLRPITFQIDERDQSGTYCWTSGPQDRRRQDYDKGKLDSNDELVVLSREVGARALPQQLAQVGGALGFQEIEFTDPLDQGKAWIYLFVFPPKAVPPSDHIDLTELRVQRHPGGESTHYWFGESFMYNNDRSRMNAVRATYVGMGEPGTRNFKGIPNMVDSTQVRAVVSFMWVTLTRQSNDIKVEIGGIIDGPLRVIAENKLKVHLAMGYWVEAPNSFLVLWRNKMSMPTNANCPVNLDESDDSSYTLCVDMHKENARGLRFFNSHNPQPVIIDGLMSPPERKLDMSYPDWNCIYGKQGAMMSKFVIPPFLKRKAGSKLVYIDDARYERPEDEEGLEFQKGAFGYHGYVMDMRGLKKGLYPGDYLVWYAPPGFKPGDQQAYLNEHDHPVEAAATTVSR